MAQSKSECRSADSRPNPWKSLWWGSLSGGIEVLINHPMWVLKTRAQQPIKFPLNDLRLLYRGIIPNTLSMVPITGVQVGLTRYFEHRCLQAKYTLTPSVMLACAGFSGCISAFICGPTELIMTHQGKSQQPTNFYTACQQLVREGGVARLSTGLLATMLREGLFTAFYLAVTPILKQQLSYYNQNDYLTTFMAGLGAGIGATLLTQGVDTVKTLQQSAEKPEGFVQTSKTLYRRAGALGFFDGGKWRGARLVSAITVLWVLNEESGHERLQY